jgi:hypothetical protein
VRRNQLRQNLIPQGFRVRQHHQSSLSEMQQAQLRLQIATCIHNFPSEISYLMRFLKYERPANSHNVHGPDA